MNEPSTRVLPASWVERIFDRMQGMYGTLWLDRWRTGEMIEMAGRQIDRGLLNAKTTWAAELAGFADKAGCIGKALDSCRSRSLPPTLPEFIQVCRETALRAATVKAEQLSYTPTAEDRERQREAAQKVADAAQKKSAGAAHDPMAWCKKPGSQIAMNAIIEEARCGNEVLAEVFEEHKASGVCSETGKLLKRWDNGQWVAA